MFVLNELCYFERYLKLYISGSDSPSINFRNKNCEKLNQSKLHEIENENETIKVMSLNCCGLKTRLQYPEFQNLIQSNDIMCLVETKTDDIDVVELRLQISYEK